MKRTLAGLIMLLAASLSACSGLAGGLFAPGLPLVTADPNAPATPTAFMPLSPTETPIPTATATPGPTATPTPVNPWGSFPGPVEPSAIEIPPPLPAFTLGKGAKAFALLGSDIRPNDGGWRTDTILIVVLDPASGTARILAVPRDLYVYIPGWRVDRINTADVRGGFDMLAQTILYNFGIPIDHMVRIDFSGFTRLVDSLGGLDVQVTGYLNDECGRRHWSYSPGVFHMDGFTALCYVRMRKASSDFDRLRREQEVLLAMFDRVVSLNGLARIPELYDQVRSLVKTDLEVNDLLPLVPLAASLAADRTRLSLHRVDTTVVTSWTVPYSGASVQLPNRDALLTMLRTVFAPPA
jgi:LCP family protein required for cell wall assembly